MTANDSAVVLRPLDVWPFRRHPMRPRVAAAMWYIARAPHGVITNGCRHEYLHTHTHTHMSQQSNTRVVRGRGSATRTQDRGGPPRVPQAKRRWSGCWRPRQAAAARSKSCRCSQRFHRRADLRRLPGPSRCPARS